MLYICTPFVLYTYSHRERIVISNKSEQTFCICIRHTSTYYKYRWISIYFRSYSCDLILRRYSCFFFSCFFFYLIRVGISSYRRYYICTQRCYNRTGFFFFFFNFGLTLRRYIYYYRYSNGKKNIKYKEECFPNIGLCSY